MIMIWGLQIEGLIHVGEVHPLAMLEHWKCWPGEVFPAFGIKVIAGASIPLVFFSDKMTIVSCSRYFSTHGIPRDIDKRAKRIMCRVKWVPRTNVEHKCLSLPFIFINHSCFNLSHSMNRTKPLSPANWLCYLLFGRFIYNVTLFFGFVRLCLVMPDVQKTIFNKRRHSLTACLSNSPNY